MTSEVCHSAIYVKKISACRIDDIECVYNSSTFIQQKLNRLTLCGDSQLVQDPRQVLDTAESRFL